MKKYNLAKIVRATIGYNPEAESINNKEYIIELEELICELINDISFSETKKESVNYQKKASLEIIQHHTEYRIHGYIKSLSK